MARWNRIFLRGRHGCSRSEALILIAILVALSALVAWTFQASGATPRVHAIQNARVILAPDRALPRATILLRDGVILAVGPNLTIPADARVWDAESLTVYPGFIDPCLRRTRLEGKEIPGGRGDDDGPDVEPPQSPGDVHPIPRIHPEFSLTERQNFSDEWWAPYRALGFTAGYVVPDSGIFRGRGAVLSLSGRKTGAIEISSPRLQCLAWDTGRGSDGYPRSIMGVHAAMRQTLLDARWYRDATRAYQSNPVGQERPLRNASLEALELVLDGREAVYVETRDVLATLRAGQLLSEFGLKGIVRGSGEEYKYLREIAAMNASWVLPIAFPDPPAFEGDDEAIDVSLESLRNWDHAPSNPARLEQAGVPFALTTDLLREPDLFWPRLRTAIDRGLSRETALRALTTEPARLLGVSDRLGSIDVGKIANLVVTDGDLFTEGVRVRQVWIDGDPIEVPTDGKARDEARGLWRVEVLDADAPREIARLSWLRVSGKEDSLVASWTPSPLSSTERREPRFAETAKAGHDTLRLEWAKKDKAFFAPAELLLRAGLPGEKQGYWRTEDGDHYTIRAEKRAGPTPIKKKEHATETETPFAVVAGPIAEPKSWIVRGARLWTNTERGILEDTDLLVLNGKIVAVGEHLTAPADALVIEGQDFEVTPGIMDCHSHTAGDGDINEGTLASSCMVRLGDIVNPRSRTIYEQFAGGVTAVNMLHGSANPIGGQSQVLKLRWGATPEAMKFAGADPAIKCALGENVTQKSWGERFVRRYPKTRMGVEQFFKERFAAARDYEADWKEWNALSADRKAKTIPPKRDLELDCLVEILNSQRFIHCHSYRQDEILMLMRVAESFGFRIRVFQHILEGYKVADEMGVHGAAGSAFSDWWAYKPEVYDAIPYAGAIMFEQGVNVSYNSDSSELARRLNLECAKAVKYGGVPEVEAMKFVTLNVAQQLGVDDQVGSLAPGKDADIAIWSGSPLSTGTVCLQTWIDGKKYFDRAVDLENRVRLAAERAELLAKVRRVGSDDEGHKQGPPERRGYEDGGNEHCMPRDGEGGVH